MAKPFGSSSKRTQAAAAAAATTKRCYQFSSCRRTSGKSQLESNCTSSLRFGGSKAGTGPWKKQRDLDPQRSLCLPIPADPRESERGGRQVEQQELQEEEAGSRLHHFHRDHSSFFSNPPLAATAFSSEDAGFPGRTGDHHGLSYSQLSLLQRPPPPAKTELGRSRHGGRGGRGKGFPMGEIVEVQGGHIMRSTGRKDRHSKVCTAKGPRDRRVRLSAHTAIQFYDVQDRLGFDRPSKAVDWLIKNAKAKIDELAELPPWSPTATHTAATQAASSSRMPCSDQPSESEPGKEQIAIAVPVLASGRGGNQSTSFLPPSLHSDSIANIRKSFFPIAAAAPATWVASSPTVGGGSQVKDLRLSLQSLQDAIYHDPEPVHHNQHDGQFRQSPPPPAHNSHFQGNAQLAFAVTSADWAEQSQRIVPWNVVESGVSGIGGGGYMLSLPPPHAVPLHTVLGQNQLFSQGGPLQSSDAHTVRAWTNPTEAIAHHQFQAAFQPSMSSIGFAADGDLPGFRIPARFQGEEEHDGISDKPPSAA